MVAAQPHLLETANRFPSPDALSAGLADRVAEVLDYAVAARGRASLVVSGGRTPIALFETLSRRDVPWDRVTITLADERWVPPDSPDSNEHLVREHLLRGPAAAAGFVGLYQGDVTLDDGEPLSQKALKSVPRPFDAVILGMGGDGHTASLFPGSPQLDTALDTREPALCRAVRADAPPHERMTLTLRALLDSRWIGLHITGNDKWKVLEEAARPGPVREFPVRCVLHQRKVPVHVYWSP